jgi:SAM-dependent methyltransferase
VVYTELHGRRYCKDYYMPNDEDEQTRLQMLNGVYYSLFGHRLTTVPLTNPKKILDIGTGTGEWAMAMGDEYPETEVIGTDIAKIQPGAAPLNVFFEIDDAEEEHGWTWADDEFDFIHFRYMCGAFTSWDHIYRQTFKHLKPGGWIEVIDFDDHATLLQYFPSSTSAVPRFLSSIVEGCRLAGRPRTTTHLEPASLAGLGFVDVRCTTYDIPMGVWPDDAQAQKNGKHSLVTMLLGLEAVSLRVLTEQLGWSVDEVRNICDAVTRDVWKIATDADRAHGFGVKLKVLVARKPEVGEGKGEGEGG